MMFAGHASRLRPAVPRFSARRELHRHVRSFRMMFAGHASRPGDGRPRSYARSRKGKAAQRPRSGGSSNLLPPGDGRPRSYARSRKGKAAQRPRSGGSSNLLPPGGVLADVFPSSPGGDVGHRRWDLRSLIRHRRCRCARGCVPQLSRRRCWPPQVGSTIADPSPSLSVYVFQVEYAFLLAGPDGLLDRVEDHGGGHRGSDPPAQDPASVGVGDKGHVGEPCPGRHIGEVCYPQAVGSRPHLCVDLGRVRLRGLCHRRLRSQDPGLRVASTMATSMVLDAIEQAIWTRQQEGVLDLKDVLWVADLTYVSTWAGFAYVAFVTDAYARRILGCGRFHDGHLHGPRRDRASHLDPPTRRRTRPERRCPAAVVGHGAVPREAENPADRVDRHPHAAGGMVPPR